MRWCKSRFNLVIRFDGGNLDFLCVPSYNLVKDSERRCTGMFRFTKDCVIGVEQLDREHEHLFELINSILEMIQNHYVPDRYSQIKGLLQELDDYAEQHFANEEAYMEKIRDPELIIQRSQHMMFRDKVRDWEFKDIDEFQEQIDMLKEMMLFLAEWLYQHIIGSDTMIGKLPPLEEWMLKEDICQFSEEYLIGNELIDNEHQELFRLIGKANTLVREGVDVSRCDEIMDILAELKAYTEFHFSDEEEYMESIHYEGLEAQKRAHTAFVYKVGSIKKEDIEKQPQEYMQSLVEYLLGWLINHILYTDKKIPT